MRILVFTSYYLPGWRAGGAPRAAANAIAQFQEEHEFFVVALDRDEGDRAPYPDARIFEWQERYGCRICYIPNRGPWAVRRAIQGIAPDLIWIISYFSPLTVCLLALRRLGLAGRGVPVLLAPQGEVSPQTLALKARKKSIYRKIARWAGLYRGVQYQATSEQERESIARFAHRDGIHLAPNLLPPGSPGLGDSLSKQSGELRLAFVSRIDNKKNLKFLLQVLASMDDAGAIRLEIYGPVNAPEYWAECLALMATLPGVQYRGPLPHERVSAALAEAHFSVLPTLDENFGYAVAESWQAARPVIISQGTPWRELEQQQAGYDLPLEEEAWKRTLRACVAMGEEEWRRLCRGSQALYARIADASPERAKTAAMFRAAAARPGRD